MLGENVKGKTILGVDSRIKIFTKNASGEQEYCGSHTGTVLNTVRNEAS